VDYGRLVSGIEEGKGVFKIISHFRWHPLCCRLWQIFWRKSWSDV